MERYERSTFIWFLVSSDLKLLINKRWIFSRVVNISDFRILSGCIEKYKPALGKSDSSGDNSYCVRLVIVLLDVNVDILQFLVNEDIFLCWVFSNFWSDFLLWDVADLLRMQKSIVDSCLDKKVSDWLISFETCWSSLLRLLMVLRRSLLGIDKASLFETFGSLKIRNFGYTPSCLQLLKKLFLEFVLIVL